MLNILIADSNIDYAINLMSHINSLSDNIRVINITLDGRETLNFLNDVNNSVDIVLLDYNTPMYNAMEILDKISEKQQNKYQKSFIITSDNPKVIEKLNSTNNNLIYTCLSRELDVSEIVSYINDVIVCKRLQDNVNSLRPSIQSELLYLGYDFSHKGTQYLLDIINMIYLRGESLLENLNKLVYPVIARKYHQSCNNIKCNVIRSTEYMYYNCDEKKLLEYFSFCEPAKPNMKTVINAVITRINTVSA